MKKDVNALLVELERLQYVESRLGPNGKEWRLTEKGRRELNGPSGLELPAKLEASIRRGRHSARRAS